MREDETRPHNQPPAEQTTSSSNRDMDPKAPADSNGTAPPRPPHSPVGSFQRPNEVTLDLWDGIRDHKRETLAEEIFGCDGNPSHCRKCLIEQYLETHPKIMIDTFFLPLYPTPAAQADLARKLRKNVGDMQRKFKERNFTAEVRDAVLWINEERRSRYDRLYHAPLTRVKALLAVHKELYRHHPKKFTRSPTDDAPDLFDALLLQAFIGEPRHLAVWLRSSFKFHYDIRAAAQEPGFRGLLGAVFKIVRLMADNDPSIMIRLGLWNDEGAQSESFLRRLSSLWNEWHLSWWLTQRAMQGVVCTNPNVMIASLFSCR
jgi:hypothetical protein